MYVVIFPTIPLYFADKEAKVQKRLSELLKSYGQPFMQKQDLNSDP